MTVHRTLIFGHSHIWAIRKALALGTYRPTTSVVQHHVILCGTKQFPGPLICYGAGSSEFVNFALASALSRFPPPVGKDEKYWLVSGVQGNYYNIVGMLDGDEKFDFVLPEHEELSLVREACIVPYTAVRQMLLAQMKELSLFFRRLSHLGYSGLIHLGVPPPIEDSNIIATQLAADPKFNDKPISVTPASVRRKLWLLQEQLLRELCRKAGVHYLPAPSASLNDDGYLQDTFCKDAVHANVEYAALVLHDLEHLIPGVPAR